MSKLILHVGVCHSDIHTARNEWHGSTYPVVPGHENVVVLLKLETTLVLIKLAI
jgi:D-arabinose 1-dehydrogenase-like Zn-dependent alcohol dehydrogenase